MIIANGVGTEALFTELNDAVEALAGDRVVCLNAHVAPGRIPPGAIVYNQENVPLQVSTDMYQGHEVWDFSARNCEAWRAAGRKVTHVPVGYHPSMERFTMRPWEERDIDVIMTGLLNDRRERIIVELKRRGLKVVVLPPGIYGEARDEMLSRSKLALAVLYYPDGVYGTLRAAHCAANKLPLVSERAADMPPWVSDGVAYDELVDTVMFLLERGHASSLQGRADVTYETFKCYPMALPQSEPKAEPAPALDPYRRVRTAKPDAYDINKMYDELRGQPVSDETRVHIAVPFYRESWRVGQTVVSALENVMGDLAANGVDSDFTRIDGDSLICRMRQRACHQFLMSSATHLLFCDGDIEVLDPTCVRRMLKSGHDIVAGAAPFKSPEGRVVCNVWPGSIEALEDGSQLALHHGCFEVMDAGTGFMLISRYALVKMMAAHPELMHWSRSETDNGAPLWALFDTGLVDGTYQSEDYMFCRRWQTLGGKIYVYVPATFRHWGDYGYEGSFCQQFGFAQG